MQIDDPDLAATLVGSDADRLPFGVILLDERLAITGYNRAEAEISGLEPRSVLGKRLFTDVAPCMNTPEIRARIDSATPLDETVSYMLSLRMRMTPVRIRIIVDPATPLRAVCIRKNAP